MENPFQSPTEPASEAAGGGPPPVGAPGRRLVAPRSIRFGFLAGLVWSLLPAVLLAYRADLPLTLTIFAAGIATGVLVSFAAAWPLSRWSVWSPPLFGVALLPVAALLFGVLVTWLQFGALPGRGTAYRYGEGAMAPLLTGWQYARMATSHELLPLLAPLAIGTAYALRTCLRRPAPNARIDAEIDAGAASVDFSGD